MRAGRDHYASIMTSIHLLTLSHHNPLCSHFRALERHNSSPVQVPIAPIMWHFYALITESILTRDPCALFIT
jgi:hypothetical protein